MGSKRPPKVPTTGVHSLPVTDKTLLEVQLQYHPSYDIFGADLVLFWFQVHGVNLKYVDVTLCVFFSVGALHNLFQFRETISPSKCFFQNYRLISNETDRDVQTP